MYLELSSPRPQDSVSALKAERAALARSLAAERQRAQAQARAHDARLAELHGVIAELMRRRAQDQSNAGIPEEASDRSAWEVIWPAHDAGLAELHGVIAELMRRRAQDQSNAGIPEEASDRSGNSVHLLQKQDYQLLDQQSAYLSYCNIQACCSILLGSSAG
ncbi:unnamed protein product [Plutella xylostella]|uniref:(diamondback moth) hypothetical protein n=1 Tax=Plutella xylostella TaxID=51655 RepID=A0A8S4F3J8_PLUXY|nr:unnamed protein product [Plutella xylostella]